MDASQNIKWIIICAITIIVIAITIILYYHFRPKGNKCLSGVPGTCAIDKDCNYPNGVCYKNSNGECGCTCAPGFSGPNCQTQGIPYNSPQCMGPNSEYTPGKTKDGLCVCPPGNWASGTDAKYGYVQCLQCAGGWGPLGGKTPCSKKWTSTSIATQNCYGPNFTGSPCASEYPQFSSQVGPTGQKGSVVDGGNCNSSNSCRCGITGGNAYQHTCAVSGWIDPNANQPTCATSSNERPCGSYTCNMGSSTAVWTKYPNTAAPKLSGTPTNGSISQLEAICNTTANCNGITYGGSPSGGNNVVYTSNMSPADLQSVIGVDTYIKTMGPPPPFSKWTKYSNMASSTPTISETGTISQLQTICNNKPGCNSITYGGSPTSQNSSMYPASVTVADLFPMTGMDTYIRTSYS